MPRIRLGTTPLPVPRAPPDLPHAEDAHGRVVCGFTGQGGPAPPEACSLRCKSRRPATLFIRTARHGPMTYDYHPG